MSVVLLEFFWWSVMKNLFYYYYWHRGVKCNCVLIFFNLCRTLCGLILFLCLVGSIVDILLSFTKPHSTPVNKSDGFMPIRKVSIATDHDEAPSVPFGDDNPNNAHMIHPSPEVYVSGSGVITSLQQQTVKPSKCRVWSTCLHCD